MASTEDERARMDVTLKDVETPAGIHPAAPQILKLAKEGSLDRFQSDLHNCNHPLDFKAGRDVYDDRTSLHLAAMQGHEELVEFILTHPRISREVVNAKDLFGYTPLHLAVREQRQGVVSLLLLSSLVLPDRYLTVTSEPDERGGNHGGYTPLHLAAVTGNVVIAKLLLRQPCQLEFPENPVNIQAITWNGDTALDIARQQSYPELVELLENSDLRWLQQERERNAMSANAILVGAALVAAVAFGCWLQPPGGIPTSSISSSSSSQELASFYIFVALAFACSVTALVIGTLATVPYTGIPVRVEVQQLRRAVRFARRFMMVAVSALLWCSSYAGHVVFEKLVATSVDLSNWKFLITVILTQVTIILVAYYTASYSRVMGGQYGIQTRMKYALVALLLAIAVDVLTFIDQLTDQLT